MFTARPAMRFDSKVLNRILYIYICVCCVTSDGSMVTSQTDADYVTTPGRDSHLRDEQIDPRNFDKMKSIPVF